MVAKRLPYLQERNRIFSRLKKSKNDSKSKEKASDTDQVKEENFQNLFNLYVNLIHEKAVSKITKKEGKKVKQERINVFMNPSQFKYLAKALLKISEKNGQDYSKFKSVLTFFQHLHSKKLQSPQSPPLLLNDLQNFEEKLHNYEMLHKNNHLIKNLSLGYDTQLCSDEVPFLLITKSEFQKDIDDKENMLKGMICGLANHRGGFIMICQQSTTNRIRSGLKQISKEFIDSIKFKLETVLNTIARNQDIGIEVQLKPLKQFNDKETEKEYVVLVQVKINPQKSFNGFYIERKKQNELYKQELQNNDKQKLISKYNSGIYAMHHQFPQLQFKKLFKEMNENNVQSLKRLFCGQYENEWVCKEVKEYEEMRKIMKFNMKKEASKDLKWKQKFVAGITLNIEQIREKSLKFHSDEDNHLRQICNYFMSRKQQSKKEIAQFFSQIPNQYSIGFIVRGQMMQMATINRILQGILKQTKTPYKIVVPFFELQQKIGKFRKQKKGAFQNYYYYVSFKGKYEHFYKDFKQQLDKNKILSVKMKQATVKSQVDSFLTSEDWQILKKTIYQFFNDVPQIVKNKVNYLQISEQQCKENYCSAFFQGEHKVEIQVKKKKFIKPTLKFKDNQSNASLFCQFLLSLTNKNHNRQN